MSAVGIFEALRVYLEIGALLALGYAALAFAARAAWAPARWVSFGYAVLLCALAFPAVSRAIPRAELFYPAVQVWDGAPRAGIAPAYALMTAAGKAAAVGSEGGIRLSERILACLGALLLAGALAFALRLLARVAALHWRVRRLPLVRRLGRVRIYVSDDDPVAFSAWFPGRARVVVPSPLLSQPRDLRIALRHELHHHRRGDTRWLYLAEILKAAYFWNPLVTRLAALLGELQEFACDEFLIGRRKIAPREYGSCLLRAAESAVGARFAQAGTTGMAATSDRSHLQRRISMILKPDSSVKGRRAPFALALAIGTVAVMAFAAVASRAAIQDRALTLTEARHYAAALDGSPIPITVNESVLSKLNHFIGTPEGRRFVQNGLALMPKYQDMIHRKIGDYGAPEDLIAIALYESGFRDDLISPTARAAGIWQFVPQTARRYGLNVSASDDERLDASKETDAAMRYFRDLNAEFQDWRLAIEAYNQGERKIESLIDQYGTRDPWTLETLSPGDGGGYLSGAMAMMIILRNPELLR